MAKITKLEDTFLATIRAESKTATEFARRAEAWNSSLAKPYTDREVARFWANQYATSWSYIVEEMARHRKARLNNQSALWSVLARGISREEA